MKKLLLFLIIFMFSANTLATSYIKLWVNGQVSNQLTQGDLFAWEFDVSQNGGSGAFQLILDLNENGTIEESDVVLIKFDITDGESGNDGPGDSSNVADGIVYTDFGPFGFAPAHYIMHVTDNNNGTKTTADLQIMPISNPIATLSGNLSIENKTAPDPALANIMIGSQLRLGYSGYWSGLTNEHGNYVINLPPEAVGQEWDVSIFFDDQVQGYIQTNGIDLVVMSGANTGFNFMLTLADAFVYGKLKDNLGNDIILNDGIAVYNENADRYYDAEIIDGSYVIPVSFEVGQSSGQFTMDIWGENLPPDYMIPNLWDDPLYNFGLSMGDSIEKNVVLTSTDDQIVIEIYKDNQSPEQEFMMEAYNETHGRTRIITSTDGKGTMAVKSGGLYRVNIITDPEYGTPLPEGYAYDGPDFVEISAGDTASFRLIPTVSEISETDIHPENTELMQNYPNPFNPVTTISYTLKTNAEVKFSVYNILGKEIKSLVNRQQNAGKYKVIFNGNNLPSGIYFYKLETSAGYSKTEKMVLVK